LEALTPKQFQEALHHLLKAAGNPRLMTPALIQTLCEHAAGNLRLLMNMAREPLAAGSRQKRQQIDEQLCFEVFCPRLQPAKRS
jgi:general secretion pathway protein A